VGAAAFLVSKLLQIPLQGLVDAQLAERSTFLQLGITLSFAPLFEELARYATFGWILKKARSYREGVFVGLGHGGFEAMAIGVLVLVTVSQVVDVPEGTAEALYARDIRDAPFWIYLLACLERPSAMIFHCGASLLVMEVFRSGRMRYLLYAMGLHYLLNAVGIIMAQNYGVAAAECAIVLVALIPLVIVMAAHQRDRAQRALSPIVGESPDAEMALSCRGLTRAFGDIVAFEDVTLDIPKGELFALLGPNGAGKTTLVRTLAALMPPTAGRAAVAGHNLGEGDDAIRAAVGVLTEVPGLYENLSAEANLRLFGQLEGVGEPALSSRIETLLTGFDLWERRSDHVGTFSKGMRQKVSIARAMIHEPPVLFLDEPTSGLDPSAARDLRELISDLRAQGHTIFLTTHRLEEAEQLADRVAIIRRKLLVVESVETLKRSLKGQQVSIHALNASPEWVEPLEAMSGVANVTLQDHVFTATVGELDAHVPMLVAKLASLGAEVRAVSDAEDSLEEVYLQMVAEDAAVADGGVG